MGCKCEAANCARDASVSRLFVSTDARGKPLWVTLRSWRPATGLPQTWASRVCWSLGVAEVRETQTRDGEAWALVGQGLLHGCPGCLPCPGHGHVLVKV